VSCGQYDIYHFLVKCPTAKIVCEWIAKFNNFTFNGNSVDDLWLIDCCIPLKDRGLVELIRGAVCLVIWLERNNIIFNNVAPSSFRSLGLKIINFIIFGVKQKTHLSYLNYL
jgi:hypothetical protein